MFKQTSTLWQNKDFLKAWFGESISLIGSQVSQFALPLLAVLNFQADPFQGGLLGTVGLRTGVAGRPYDNAFGISQQFCSANL